MISQVKSGIFVTTQKLLNIFEKSFIQIEAMDNIYHSHKLEFVLIEVSWRRDDSEQGSYLAYINHAGTR